MSTFHKKNYSPGGCVHILLTNDDGINAVGLRALHETFTAHGHTVTVVAPETEQSGVSSSVTIHAPLRFRTVYDGDFSGVSLAGTPVDCVKFAVTTLCSTPPDLVVSGLNAGNNAGVDVFYSGTVAAAVEAAFLDLPALAVSRRMFANDDPLGYAEKTACIVDQIDWQSVPKKRLLNLNYPACSPAQVKGLRVCGLSMLMWRTEYVERKDPRDRPYWWLSDAMPTPAGDASSTDFALLRAGDRKSVV